MAGVLPKDIGEEKPVRDTVPCPFCGCKDIVIVHEGSSGAGWMRCALWYEARCTNDGCRARVIGSTADEARAKWERRA